MVIVGKPDFVRRCNSCSSKDGVIEIEARNSLGQGIALSLCRECRKVLLALLKEQEEKDG